MKRFLLPASFVLLPALLLASDPPQPFTGKVVKVADGDTITVLVDICRKLPNLFWRKQT